MIASPALGIAVWGLAVFTLLGLAFGFALAVAAARFQVPVNPLVERVRDRLPAANCGACFLGQTAAPRYFSAASRAAPEVMSPANASRARSGA